MSNEASEVERSHEERGADGEAEATGVDLAEQLAGVLIEGELDIIAAIFGVGRGETKENSPGCRCGKRDAGGFPRKNILRQS